MNELFNGYGNIVEVSCSCDGQEPSTPSTQSLVMAPIVAFSDDFGKSKKVKVVGDDYTETETDAYELTGVSVNRSTTFDCFMLFSEANAKLKMYNSYTAEYRKAIYEIKLVDASSVIRIGNEISYDASEGQNHFTLDFGRKKFITSGNKSYDLTIDSIAGGNYFVEIDYEPFSCKVTVKDVNNNGQNVYNYKVEMKGCPFILLESGEIQLRSIKILLYGANCDYYITGDSILMNKACDVDKRWANLFKDIVPNTVVSGRGTSDYKEVLKRLYSEIDILKPKTIIDQNWVNGATNQYVDYMYTYCRNNGIRYIHTMATLQGMYPNGGRSAYIITKGIDTIRFDKATAINGNLEEGIDLSLFNSDKLHPNNNGSLKMFERLKMELGL